MQSYKPKHQCIKTLTRQHQKSFLWQNTVTIEKTQLYNKTRELVKVQQFKHAITDEMKKRSEETQTLRAGCSKAELKIFALPQTPFPGAQDSQNLISWRWSLPIPTKPVWWGSMQAISSYCGNRPTHTHTPTHKQIRMITIHCAAASAQRNYKYK